MFICQSVKVILKQDKCTKFKNELYSGGSMLACPLCTVTTVTMHFQRHERVCTILDIEQIVNSENNFIISKNF